MALADRIAKRIDELVEKGDKVLATWREFGGFGSLDAEAFYGYFAQVQNFLIRFIGLDKEHPYVQGLGEKVMPVRSAAERAKGILQAVREDILSGYLTDVKALIAAEVFADFLDMADHLLECGYKDPAASLCGAVLEDGLRRIASNAGITLKPIEGLNSLNSKCAKAGVYSELLHRRVQVWTNIRNSADHGKFNEYSRQDVQDMLKGVRQLLEDHLR